MQLCQDGLCFWSGIAAGLLRGGVESYAISRGANGVPLLLSGRADVNRNLEEVENADRVMGPFMQWLQETGRGNQIRGFQSGARLVEVHMINEIALVLQVDISIVLPSMSIGFSPPHANPDTPPIYVIATGDDEGLQRMQGVNFGHSPVYARPDDGLLARFAHGRHKDKLASGRIVLSNACGRLEPDCDY